MPAHPLTIAALLHGRRQRGDHPLLVCDGERLSYDEADRRSAELARGLIALGAGKGTHVGLLYPNGAQFVIAMLAAARIGAVVVPFSTFATAAELRTQLIDSDVVVMLAAATFRGHDYRLRFAEILAVDPHEFDTFNSAALFNVNAPTLRHLVFDRDALTSFGQSVDESLQAAAEADVDGPDPLTIVYTSGSTGAPKGAVHSHAGLLQHQRDLNAIRALTTEDRLFCNSPFFWIGGFAFGLLATLVAGATLVCSNATDAGATLDLLEAERPTITNGFAAAIAHLARHPSFSDRDLSTMRRGNLYPIMAPDARPTDPGLRHNMLGMTEAGSVLLMCADESNQPEYRRGSYGQLTPGFDAKVIDPDTESAVPVGHLGELCIRGPAVMLGYYGRIREDCFDDDGWFHTGDLVRTDEDGFFYFSARAGSMIKTAGANVTPAEVEQALLTVLENATGAEVTVHVVGLPDAQRGQIVAAVIAFEDNAFHDAAFDESAVRLALKGELSAYKIPKLFAICRHSDLPLKSSGKVDLPALAELFDA
jgi:acyl-CoA synthetase (AMP-forming)/AMP-acid ligase II